MKSTWFGNSDRYDFARLLAEADYSHRTYELFRMFRMFLVCCCGAFEQASRKYQTGKMCDLIEAEVIRTQKQLKHPEKFSHAMGAMVCGLEKDPHDFLGTVFMEIGANDISWKGQCFTPPSVCTLMAQMTYGSIQPTREKTVMFHEPACGAGAMIIASSQVLKNNGFGPRDYLWHAVDIDWMCYAMTYIQTTLLAIPAVVHHGNTLTMKMTKSTRNLISAMHPERRAKPVEEFAECAELVAAERSQSRTQKQLF